MPRIRRRETSGHVEHWDDPEGDGIPMQGDSLAELDHMLREAVEGSFAGGRMPGRIRLHRAM